MRLNSTARRRIFLGWLSEDHIPRLVFWTSVLSVLFTALIMGALLLVRHSQFHKAELIRLEREYLDAQKDYIQLSIESEIARIDFRRLTALEFARKEIKARVQSAHSMLDLLYRQAQGQLTAAGLDDLARATLGPVRFYDGSAYFFVGDLNPENPPFIMHPMADQWDSYAHMSENERRGALGVREFVERSEEGFYEYPWVDDRAHLESRHKVAYLKKFESLGWYVGATFYVDQLEDRVREEFVDWFNHPQKQAGDFEYLFVYEIENLAGGKDFARMLINPNRPELLGESISDDYPDAKGYFFRREMLKGIRENGEAFVRYWYKKPGTGELIPKLTYFKYYPEWNWVLAKGIYFDDLNREMAEKEAMYLQGVRGHMVQISLWLLLFLLIVLFFSILISRRIGRIFRRYRTKVENRTQQLNRVNGELAELTNDLEQRVQERTEELHRKMIEHQRAEHEKRELLAQVQHQQKMDSIGTLASGIAHEINNPLHVIMGCAEIIEEESPAEERVGKYVRIIEKEAERMAEIVRGLLVFGRQDELAFEKTNVLPLVVDTLALIKTAIRHDGILISEEFAEALPEVNCRPNQIRQVVMNLLANARDAVNERYGRAEEVKRITLQVARDERADGEWVVISVDDNGNGIAPDVIGRIFDPFFTTKKSGDGTGLGLSISHGIISEHQGVLRAESEPGEFGRFVIELPAAD